MGDQDEYTCIEGFRVSVRKTDVTAKAYWLLAGNWAKDTCRSPYITAYDRVVCIVLSIPLTAKP